MDSSDILAPPPSETKQTHTEPDDDTTQVTAVVDSTRHAMSEPTLRQRLVATNSSPAVRLRCATANFPVTQVTESSSTTATADALADSTSVWTSYNAVRFGVGVIGVLILSMLMAFVLVDFYSLDALNMRTTSARLKSADEGREWFPVWMTNLVINYLTRSRDDGIDAALRSSLSLTSSGQGGGPAQPPPKLSRRTPVEPLRESVSASEGSDTTEKYDARTKQTAPLTGLRCHTLEEYSDTFLQPHRQPASPRLFICGTRVVDLRSEERQEVLAGCGASAAVMPRHGNSMNSMRESGSMFPSLRVVLTPQEVQWHQELLPTDVVLQRIPLTRLNDDYCDCLDGTDELLTNACSSSGPLTPAGGMRWKSYLASIQSLRLWEANDVIAQEDTEARGYPPQPRKRGDVGDRLYVSNGPVLPFVCNCGTVRQLLAPSLIGDGIVDCCEGEDEAALQGTAYGGASSHHLNTDPPVSDTHHRAWEAVRAAMLMQWRERRVSASQYPSRAPSLYEDMLYPYHTSARAMLVDKGYYSLFTSLEVQQEKRKAAAVIKKLYADGHLIQRRRVEEGWDRLGRHLVSNSTQLQMQLVNITRELETLEQYVRHRMDEARTNSPLVAGVPMQELQRHARLMEMRTALQSEVQYISITTAHRAYGDHYEYYPLAELIMHLNASHLVDPTVSSTPELFHLKPQEERIITSTELHKMHASAYAAQEPAPPIHVDNISVSDYGVEVMRQTLVAQNVDSHEAPHAARGLGPLPNDNLSAYTPDTLDSATNPFQRAPSIPTGFWQPYRSHRNGSSMMIADPAGDVHLAHRACVAPASNLYRGGGRLQWPTRHPEAPRVVRIPDPREKKKSPKDKLKAASAGNKARETPLYIPYHTNMPSILAVDVYEGNIRCEHDPPLSSSWKDPRDAGGRSGSSVDDALPHPAKTLTTLVSYLCDTQDRILHWAKNGKCLQEVLIGTPSACTGWALKVATKRVEEIEERANML